MKFCQRKMYSDVLDLAYTSRISDDTQRQAVGKARAIRLKYSPFFKGCVSQEYGTEFEANLGFGV